MSVRNNSISHQYYLGVGSNIEPEHYIPLAINLLSLKMDIQKLSNVWESLPVGGLGANYLNLTLLANTYIEPDRIKDTIIHPVETELCRVRNSNKYSPRTIDIDVLIVDNRIIEPAIFTQAFWALPLSEIYPALKNPITEEPLTNAATRLFSEAGVKPGPDLQLALITKQ